MNKYSSEHSILWHKTNCDNDKSFLPVHGDAHDVGEDGTAGADEGAHHGHQVVVEHEAFSTERPAGVGVQHSDHNYIRSQTVSN